MEPWSIDPVLQYQGVLRDANTGELVNGETEVTFALYHSEIAPSVEGRIWEEGHMIDVTNGLVSIVLGTIDPLPPEAFLEDEVWLGVFVGADELEPRQQLLPVAFALRSNIADHAESAETAETAENANRLQGQSASDFLGAEGPQTITADSDDWTLRLQQNGDGVALNADGAVSATAYEYSETQTRTVRISGYEFHPPLGGHWRGIWGDESVYFWGTHDGSVPGTGGTLIAPVRLPVGATVVSMTGIFEDNDPSDSLRVRFFKRSPEATFSTYSATVTSTSVEGLGEVSTNFLNPQTIDLEHTYFLRARAIDNWMEAGSGMRLHAVKLTYEIDEVH